MRLELLEHLLKIEYYASSMGGVMTLPPEDKRKLLEKRASIGLGPKGGYSPVSKQPQGNQQEILKKLIAEELKKVLSEQK